MATGGFESGESDGQTRFVWPPRPVDDEPETRHQPTSDDIGRVIETKGPPATRPDSLNVFQFDMTTDSPAGWIASLETALLGTRALVLTGRDGRWTPEPMDASCPSCGRSVGWGEVSPSDRRCTQCRAEKLPWERFVRLGAFRGELRDAIHAMKYEAWRAQGTALGRLLGYRILDALHEAGVSPAQARLVPVPMPTLRRLTRGIDHTLVLTRAASQTSGVGMLRMLSRRGGKPQVEVAPSLRANNLRKKVRSSVVHQSAPQVVVLIDDVKTTGATLRACSRAVLGGFPGEKPGVWSAVLGVTSEKRPREITENAPKA